MRNRTRTALLVLAVVLTVSLFAVPVAGIESTSSDLPDETEVGTQTEATFEVTDLYDEFEDWTLVGETNLTNVTWTVVQMNQAGDQISQESYDGATFESGIDIDDGTNTVEVRVTGTVPEIETLRYDPPETYTYAEFTLTRNGGTEGTIETHEVHHYTEASKSSREVIAASEESVEAADDDGARRTLNNAISAYEAGDFDNANDLADQAQESADRSQLIDTAIQYGVVAIVVLVIVAVGIFTYRKRQSGPGRLR